MDERTQEKAHAEARKNHRQGKTQGGPRKGQGNNQQVPRRGPDNSPSKPMMAKQLRELERVQRHLQWWSHTIMKVLVILMVKDHCEHSTMQ